MYYIGIDLGGTNIAAGIVSEDGKIVKKASIPTPSMDDYVVVAKAMLELSKKLVSETGISADDVKAVGIGCPGSIDYEKNEISYSNNLRFSKAPIAKEFQKGWDIPVVLENDANAAAFGEYIASGNGCSVFVALTLGTGVGGGVVINGKIFRGANGAGAELGHSTLIHDGLSCTCGKKGCLECYASATALINQTTEAIKNNPESLMVKLANDYGKVNGRVAFDAAKQGDEAAKKVVDQYIKYVADGIVSMVNIFQPEKLVVSGGISNEGEYLMKPIREYVEKYDYNRHFTRVKVEPAVLLNDAGIIGAALAAKI